MLGTLKSPPKGRYLRGQKGKFPRTFKQFERKWTGPKSKICFPKMKANVEQKGGRNQMCEEKKSRLAKVEGINSKGDFEQRRSGWGESENKAACFECGNTDRF